jgi:poly(3-hydroxybutyrate) depolymerase
MWWWLWACGPGVVTLPEVVDPANADAADEDSDQAPADAPPEDLPAEDTQPAEPAPCEPGDGVVPGRDLDLSLMWEGRLRTYRVHVPRDYDCTPRALVIGLHYFTGDARGFEHDVAQIHDHLNQTGTFGLFPQALESEPGSGVTSFNDLTSRYDDGPDGPTCTEWAPGYPIFEDCPPDEAQRACTWGTSCADDAGLVRELVAELSRRWTIDPDRVFLTGFSQGGIAAQGWACELADLLAAIAPLHGAAANGHTCGPTQAVSMMDVWGWTDIAINRYEAPSLDGLIYDGAEETAQVWASAQGCDRRPQPYRTVSDGAWSWGCTQQPDCQTGAEVVTCGWSGTHIWGRDGVNGDFMWAAVWAFFSSHPKVR